MNDIVLKAFLLLSFSFAVSKVSAQSWLGPHPQINIPDKPTQNPLGNIIGVNAGNQIGDDGLLYPGVLKNMRDFYTMEIDYNYSFFPADVILRENECSCENVWCNAGDCISFSDNSNTTSSFSSKKGYYCAWNDFDKFGFSEIYTALEAIFVKDSKLGDCTDQNISRRYPNKWYSLEEWGGLDSIERHYTNYLLPFLKTFCPSDTSQPCLIDVLAIGNEPWGADHPGREGYAKILNATVETFKTYYGSENSNDWRLKLSTAAFQAHNANPSSAGATESYISDMIPQSLRQYFDFIEIHSYAFPRDESSLSITYRPESENGAFLDIKNILRWRDENMPHASVNLTEFGWNAGNEGDGCAPMGQVTQALYSIRAFLLAARYDIHRAFLYSISDPNDFPVFCTMGLFEDLSDQQPRKIFESLLKLQNSPVADKMFLKALVEDADEEGNGKNGAFAYLFGDSEHKPTHLVMWRPDVLAFEDSNYPDDFTDFELILTNSGLEVDLDQDYFYLSWDTTMDGNISSSWNSPITISESNKSILNVKLSAAPLVIALKENDCVVESTGELVCAGTTSTDPGVGKVATLPYRLPGWLHNKKVQMDIFDINGRIVKRLSVEVKEHMNFLEDELSSGYYLLRVKTLDNKVFIRKFLVLN